MSLYSCPVKRGGYAVTYDARRDTRVGGTLDHAAKSRANRRNRRANGRRLRRLGEDFEPIAILWTGWDVI